MKSLLPLTCWLFLLVSASAAEAPLRLTLPPIWYGVPGVPISLYYDNIVLTEKPEAYTFAISSDLGASEARRWTVTPTEKDVGDHPMEVVVKDGKGTVLERGKTVLRIAPKNAGADRPLRLLIIGDSLTHASHYPNEIARLLSEPGNPKWTMLGTHKPGGVKPNVAHEGYGGWTWVAFLNRWAEQPMDKEKRTIRSPFMFKGADDKPALDISRYIKENCGGQAPDVVTFLLGINDCFGANPNDLKAMDKHIDGVLDNADEFIAAFRAAAPKTVFAVGLTTPPNSREEAFQANYKDKYHRWGWKRIQHRLVERMLERFSGQEKQNLFIVPTELNIDPIDGYSINNGVHPNPAGYAQIGQSFYSWLKVWLAGKAAM
jgi:lysophospholipase L1-like esterase